MVIYTGRAVGSSVGSLFINGLPVDVTSPSFNMFTLLKTLRKELDIHDTVSLLKVQHSFVQEAKTASSQISAANVRNRVPPGFLLLLGVSTFHLRFPTCVLLLLPRLCFPSPTLFSISLPSICSFSHLPCLHLFTCCVSHFLRRHLPATILYVTVVRMVPCVDLCVILFVFKRRVVLPVCSCVCGGCLRGRRQVPRRFEWT